MIIGQSTELSFKLHLTYKSIRFVCYLMLQCISYWKSLAFTYLTRLGKRMHLSLSESTNVMF